MCKRPRGATDLKLSVNVVDRKARINGKRFHNFSKMASNFYLKFTENSSYFDRKLESRAAVRPTGGLLGPYSMRTVQTRPYLELAEVKSLSTA